MRLPTPLIGFGVCSPGRHGFSHRECVRLVRLRLSILHRAVRFRALTRVQVQPPAFDATTYVWSRSLTVLSLLSQAVMVLFLTFFLLLSDDLFKRRLVETVGPTLTRKRITVNILEDIAAQIERFLLIQLLTSAIVAVATWLALWMLDVHQAAFWGAMSGNLLAVFLANRDGLTGCD
jgi:predicted PurR-regulated permease PerM